VVTARILIDRGHRLVIVHTDRERIDELSDELDCGFLHGDGSNPSILREAGPRETDVLVCMSDHDQANIIAGLVGRSLGFPRVITVITNSEYESICLELGLEETVIPIQMIGRDLADMVEGEDTMEFSSVIKGEAQVFKFLASEAEKGPIGGLELPERARPICYYREDEFHLVDDGTELRKNDEVVVLTYRDVMPELQERWKPDIPDGKSRKRRQLSGED
jgi:trk system potassium uptake protein TrkA